MPTATLLSRPTSANNNINIPTFLCDPIKGKLMVIPVVAACGHTFEKEAIEEWINDGKSCPLCFRPIDKKLLAPNIIAKQAIDDYLLKQVTTIGHENRNSFNIMKLFSKEKKSPTHSAPDLARAVLATPPSPVATAPSMPGSPRRAEDEQVMQNASVRTTNTKVNESVRTSRARSIGQKKKSSRGAAWAALEPLVIILWQEILIDEDEFTLGRSSECEYQFAEAELSGKHATIFKKQKQDALRFFVEDNSTNGTYVNGRRIAKGQPLQLNHSDIISFSTSFSIGDFPDTTSFMDWTFLSNTLNAADDIDIKKIKKDFSFHELLQITSEESLRKHGIVSNYVIHTVFEAISKWVHTHRLPIFRFCDLSQAALTAPSNTSFVRPVKAPADPVDEPLLQSSRPASPLGRYDYSKLTEAMASLFRTLTVDVIRNTIIEVLSGGPVPTSPLLLSQTQAAIVQRLTSLAEEHNEVPAMVKQSIRQNSKSRKSINAESFTEDVTMPRVKDDNKGQAYASPMQTNSRKSLVVESVMAPLPQSNHSTLPHHGSAVMSSKQSLGKASTYSTILKSEVHKYTLTHAYSIIKNNIKHWKALTAATLGSTHAALPNLAQFALQVTQAVMECLDRDVSRVGVVNGDAYYHEQDILGLIGRQVTTQYSTFDLKVSKEPKSSGIIVSSSTSTGSNHQTNEDAFVVIEDFNNFASAEDDSLQSLYAIMDGHSGSSASAYVAGQLPLTLAQCVPWIQLQRDPALAMQQACQIVDNGLLRRLQRDDSHCGTTATTVLLRDSEIVVSWVGHTMAVLYSSRGSGLGGLLDEPLITSHLPTGSEKERIEGQGGIVANIGGINRVQSRLCISRSFGDAAIKQYVPADPQTHRHIINRKERFLVIGSDAFWSAVHTPQVGKLLAEYERKGYDLMDISDALIRQARERTKLDDLTVITISFTKNFDLP